MTGRRLPSPARRVAAGYVLFEALIAVIVLSVGFIGAARMQTVGLKLNNSAHSRQKASLLAYQMTDRVRTNPSGVYVGAAAGAVTCLDSSAGCSVAEMVGADLAQWQADLGAQLPLGAGVVCIDSTPNDGTGPGSAAAQCDGVGNTLVVKVFWTDTAGNGPSVFATPVRAL